MNIEKEYPKILLVSDATWADDNNIGNTFSNLFESWPKDNIAMIYARPELPHTTVCDNFFQISENRLIKNLFNSSTITGVKIDSIQMSNLKSEDWLAREEALGRNMYRFFLKYRWNIFLTAREILWKIGKWRTKELDEYINNFNPDIVLSLACSSIYMNNIERYVLNRAKSKSILYFVDDVYLSKSKSLSLLFWINRLFIRRSIKKTVQVADLIYTIIPKQKEEYDKEFGIDSKLLSKGGVFNKLSDIKEIKKYPKKLIYTGNIYAGRWDSLVKIGRALDRINVKNNKGILYIYSRNTLTSKMERSLSEIESIKFMGSIPVSKVNKIQNDADVLVHVESIHAREKLLTRLSFSTKLVDYFTTGKCILAIGWSEAASIEYLKNNNIALTIDNFSKLDIELSNLLNSPETIREYGSRAWNFGKNNHEITFIIESIRKDMIQIVNKRRSNSQER